MSLDFEGTSDVGCKLRYVGFLLVQDQFQLDFWSAGLLRLPCRLSNYSIMTQVSTRSSPCLAMGIATSTLMIAIKN